MEAIVELLRSPWPWYVSGPMIGLMVPLMIIVGSRSFGISQNLSHLCAITQPRMIHINFFKYDWRLSLWSLMFAAGVVSGGCIAGLVFANPEPIQLSQAAIEMMATWGVAQPELYNPPEIFVLGWKNILLLFVSGVLIGFGTRYASGCTSGHAITGLATFQIQSLYAVLGIFAGGLLASYLVTPYVSGWL